MRSEQTSNEQRKGGDGAEGIPGALSNQPPGTSGAPDDSRAATPGNPAAAGAAGAAQAAASSGPSSSAQRSTRNFEVDRTLSYVKQPHRQFEAPERRGGPGRLAEIGRGRQGHDLPHERHGYQTLLAAGAESIGLKEDRGDQLNVLNQAFKGSAPIGPVEGPPLWETPWITQLAKQIVGAGLVLVVAFLVLRPLMKSLTKSSPRLGASGGDGGELEGDKVSLSGQGGKAIKLAPSFEQQIAAARTLVGQDPRRAAQVVKDWVAADG